MEETNEKLFQFTIKSPKNSFKKKTEQTIGATKQAPNSEHLKQPNGNKNFQEECFWLKLQKETTAICLLEVKVFRDEEKVTRYHYTEPQLRTRFIMFPVITGRSHFD